MNGSPTATSNAVLLLCADKAILPGSINAATVAAITLWGYGGAGAAPGVQRLPLTGASTAAISGNPNCITVTIPPAQAPDGVGVDLDGFSVVTINQGAVTDASARPSVQGSLALQPNLVEISPQLGETTGAKLTSVTASGTTNLVYNFNRILSPASSTAAANYGYVDSAGGVHTGSTLSVSGNSVTVSFAAPVVNNVRYFVNAGANLTQTQVVPNPLDAIGGTVAATPTITSAVPVSGFPGVFDVTYDQAVTINDATKFLVYTENEATVAVVAANAAQQGASTIRISLPATASFQAKIVKIADSGGAVKQTASPGNSSVQSEGDIRTPPMTYGFTDGPDLTGFSVNTSASTATFCFDGNYGNLQNATLPGALRLVNADGTISGTGATATSVAGNVVTAQYSPSQLTTAVGGTLAAPAVADGQGVTNFAPATSGIGGCNSTTGGGTTTVTQTVTATVTRTVTNTVTVNNAPCVSSKCGTGVTMNVSRQGGNDRVSGRITNSHGYCSGNVTIAIIKNGGQIGSKTTGLDNNCTYATTVHVSPRNGKKLQAHFGGNSFLNGSTSGKVNA